MKEQDKIIKIRAQKFKDLKINAFVRRNDKKMFSGQILEVAGDMIVLDDRKLGAIPITFLEIEELEVVRND